MKSVKFFDKPYMFIYALDNPPFPTHTIGFCMHEHMLYFVEISKPYEIS